MTTAAAARTPTATPTPPSRLPTAVWRCRTKRYESSSNQYPFDPLLPEAVSPAKDYYRRSGYDHGHICPSADRLCTREANIQTFYLTNMQPQIHAFNTGVWEEMETKVRNLAKQNDYT